ncbi:hypothetical protein CFC21_057692 [Triticum aestivum]|uniref:Bromo domain-containing protein n=2 Tax=Triticum aestivum TaxID=4565 RepID=A0A9R1GKF6_WHEAT|nr:hypothetical protein CFC21_057692 [Triticum aestivum]
MRCICCVRSRAQLHQQPDLRPLGAGGAARTFLIRSGNPLALPPPIPARHRCFLHLLSPPPPLEHTVPPTNSARQPFAARRPQGVWQNACKEEETKKKKKMSGKGKRRSARLLKLEEQKNDDKDGGCILDPWHIIRNSFSCAAQGKRKRNDEIQGEASCGQEIDAAYTDNMSGKGATSEQIIDYILNMLELRDRLELFAMPDDIQVGDCAERVERPGDFATLRQKNTDGTYKTLEQFEKDVYIVFQKAMSINSQDTIPYKEAVALLDQARQVFQSLKKNRMYSESDLLAWRHKQLDAGPSNAARDQQGGDAAVTPAQQRPSITPLRKKAGEKKHQIKSTPSPVKRARKGFAAATREPGGARELNRKLSYNDGAGRATPVTLPPPAFRDGQATVVYQHPQVQGGHTYQDSLRRFVRHAGLKARLATEFKILDCDTRGRHNPSPASYWNGFTPNAATYYPSGAATTSPRTTSPSSGAERPFPDCKLETDDLLSLVMLMGTPAFLERAKHMFGYTGAEDISKVTRAADDDAKVTVSEAPQTSDAGDPAATFGPFAPPKLPLSRLGFSQFAGSSAQPFMVKSNSPWEKRRE